MVEDRDLTFGRDSLRMSIVRSPAWMSFDSTAWVLSGTPRWEHVGWDTVTVRVWDKDSLFAVQTWILEILPSVHPPLPGRVAGPKDSVEIRLFTPPTPVTFTWLRGLDFDEQDTLRYAIHVSGPGIDTTTMWTKDTSISIQIMPFLQPGSIYLWTVHTGDENFTVAGDTGVFQTSPTVTGVQEDSDVPTNYALYQNYPNPFNPSTTIEYDLPAPGHVRLRVYSLLGQSVETLIDASLPAGRRTQVWDARSLPSGIYFIEMSAETFGSKATRFRQVRRMVLIR
jgi:hypothetical protein